MQPSLPRNTNRLTSGYPGRRSSHRSAWLFSCLLPLASTPPLVGALVGTLALLSLTPVAQAAETGTLRGSVRDGASQLPLDAVQVVVEGTGLPGGRTRITDAKGNFWFPVIPPGEYRITFSKDGYQNRAVNATIRLDQTTTIPPMDLTQLSYTTEAIEVVETAPVIDNTQSAVVQNLNQDYINKLPVGRSYQAIIQTLPGVSGRINASAGGPSNGNPSVRGEGQYGNNYLLEGFSTRDPLTKTTGFDLPFDALQEINVFTDGAPAEFGNFTGMVANILLKSGSNETHGSATYGFNTSASWGTYLAVAPDTDGNLAEVDVEKRNFRFHNPVLALSGPVVQDKLWYYTLFNFQSGEQQLEGATVSTRTRFNYQFLGRFTYNPFQDSGTLLNFTVQKQQYYLERAFADALTAPEATRDRAYDLLALNANFKSSLSPYLVLEGKWNRTRRSFYDIQPNNDLLTPSIQDYYSGYVYGNTPSLYSTARNRDGFALHATGFVTELVGQHVVKGGYEFHQTGNVDELIFTGGIGSEDAPAYQYVYADGQPLYRYEYRNVGPLAHQGDNNVMFVQDQWQPLSNLTLNVGLRGDNENLSQDAGRKVIDQWAIAPRLGVAWDINGDANNVVTLNAGRYYDINGLSFAQWADTRSAYYYTLCEYNPETQQYDLNCYTQDPVSNPLAYSSDLKPYHLDKFTLGFTRAINGSLAVGIKGILSYSRDLPEDAQTNPTSWAIVNPEQKRRDYEALELSIDRKFRDNWQILSSLTVSRARGTSPGSFDMGFGDGNQVGVFMDDMADPYQRMTNDYFGIDFAGLGYNTFTGFGQTQESNTDGWYGYLPEHSFVSLKVNGSYTLPFGTELGLVYELDSGHAWQRRGNIAAYGYSTFPEGRGVRFMPPTHYLDMRVAHKFVLKNNVNLTTELTVFNVLDLQGVTNYYEDWTQPFAVETNEDGSVTYLDRNGNEINQLFGKPLYYQAPRALRAYVKLEF